MEHLSLSRDMFENEMRVKEEEYLNELARKDELLLTTVCDFEAWNNGNRDPKKVLIPTTTPDV